MNIQPKKAKFIFYLNKYWVFLQFCESYAWPTLLLKSFTYICILLTRFCIWGRPCHFFSFWDHMTSLNIIHSKYIYFSIILQLHFSLKLSRIELHILTSEWHYTFIKLNIEIWGITNILIFVIHFSKNSTYFLLVFRWFKHLHCSSSVPPGVCFLSLLLLPWLCVLWWAFILERG